MTSDKVPATRVALLVTPKFNLAATMAFIDPLRAVNYLDAQKHFSWQLVSVDGGLQTASNGLQLNTTALADVDREQYDLVIVSSSWTPELYSDRRLSQALRFWSRRGLTLGAIDTGAFILAQAGLLNDRQATVHYEHLDAFIELFPKVHSSEQLCVFDGDRISCAGGNATVDFSLHIVVSRCGEMIANKAAQYLFQQSLRPLSASQNANNSLPLGSAVPSLVRNAIAVMEQHLENPLSLVAVCKHVGVSQRQLARLFSQYVGKTPVRYYLDIRLDRARGLVTQTVMPLSQVAVASGFASEVHFSRAYKKRFALAPNKDRIEGRVPFEFRAWPMHKV